MYFLTTDNRCLWPKQIGWQWKSWAFLNKYSMKQGIYYIVYIVQLSIYFLCVFKLEKVGTLDRNKSKSL